MKFEGSPSVVENEPAPAELLAYEKWWKETYGREPSPEEDKQLVGFAKKLARSDEKFKTILSESLTNSFLDCEDGFEDEGKRRWTLVTALSTYGKEFGLQVD